MPDPNLVTPPGTPPPSPPPPQPPIPPGPPSRRTAVRPLDPDSPRGREVAEQLTRTLGEIQVAIDRRRRAAEADQAPAQPLPPDPDDPTVVRDDRYGLERRAA